MTEVPKIVRYRLQALADNFAKGAAQREAQTPAHPDADVLAAFCEQGLSGTERESILEHLALCAECRELVVLALPAQEMIGAPVTDEIGIDQVQAVILQSEPRPRNSFFAWPNFAWPNVGWPKLGWAGLAAGVALAAVLFLYPGMLDQAVHHNGQQSAPPASQIASGLQPSPALPNPNLQTNVRPSEFGSSGTPEAPSAKHHSFQSRSGSVVASKRSLENSSPEDSAEVRATTSSEATSFDNSARTLIAQNDAPAIEKAKPVPPEIVAQLNGTNADAMYTTIQPEEQSMSAADGQVASSGQTSVSIWTITNGSLQRSFDSGQNWQVALRPDHRLLCYTSRDQDVWAGGESGRLFHSKDGGLTWIQVIVSDQLTTDITHIELGSKDGSVVAVTNSGETWGSADNGTTWHKE